MSVSKAGPRLYRSVPFKHLGKGGAAATKRGSTVSLNLTPFVDMMTILVTFLLMVFSTSGELIQAQKGVELPKVGPDRKDVLQVAPVIIVSKTDLSFQGAPVATIDSLLHDDNPSLKIESLFEKMQSFQKKRQEQIDLPSTESDRRAAKACNDAKQGIVDKNNLCPIGLAILQADKDTDARIINMVVTTAKYAEFDNLLFAVKNK
ncbi:MAG TPA: biopolymer transporter ExbD [Kofleriaceae bacterium]|nr:biopolymer transporter ExbD [Kofleriaceae bacterium]